MAIEVGEAVVSALGAVLRVVFVEVLWEIALKLPGWKILRALGYDPEPDGWKVVLTSCLFWALLLWPLALFVL